MMPVRGIAMSRFFQYATPMGVSAPPNASTACASHGMCRRANVGHANANRNEASAMTGPTVQREPGSHHAVIVSAARSVTVAVPTLTGTRLVASVSRRTPRLESVRVRVGEVDVITLPWSHMSGLDEAMAARAGLPEAAGRDCGEVGAPMSSERRTHPNAVVRVTERRGPGLVGEDPTVAHALCGLIHAATARVGME